MSEYQGIFKRYEKKYLVTQKQYNALAKVFAARMVPDRFAESAISNIYYDTPDFRLIRCRRPSGVQGEAAPAYLPHAGCRYRGVCGNQEKYDHIVYKRRVAMTYSEAQAYLDGGAAPEQSQISREIDWFLQFYQGIQPAMCICYDRLALFDKYQPELRVTFDSGIRWRMDDLDLSCGSAGDHLLPHDTCLMEIKIPGTTPLWLARVLSENAVFPTHFSKYGAAYQTMLREDRSPQFGSETIHINEKGEIYCA
ncbi:MAG: VTC domain-containing protein [Butyricicoccus sp.]